MKIKYCIEFVKYVVNKLAHMVGVSIGAIGLTLFVKSIDLFKSFWVPNLFVSKIVRILKLSGLIFEFKIIQFRGPNQIHGLY